MSVVLVAGVVSGALARRLHLPSITGQILVGVLIGPSVLAVFDHATIRGLEPFLDLALGLMAVAVGSHLHWARLKNAKRRLAWLLLFEALLTPVLVFTSLAFVPDIQTPFAMLVSAIAISTAPATILAMVKETHSKGVFVKTLLASVALNNLACICLFELAHTAARLQLDPAASPGFLTLVGAPLRQLVYSAALGGGIGAILVFATRNVVRPDRLTTASMLAILLTIGIAEYTGISTLLASLFLGIVLANLTPDREEIGHEVFVNFESSIFAVFFTLAGMELEFGFLAPAGLIATIVFSARFAGKLGAGYLGMRLGGATGRLRRYLGLALIPQAGLAVGLMLLVTEDPEFASIGDLFLAVVLTVVLFDEIVGPILTRIALARSGDFGKDRARLIDFVHEEHILTDLHADSMEDAIEQLTDHLVNTHQLRTTRERVLESILSREREHSTCLGEGLALPHGPLDDGDPMAGVIGISREGLRFPTPDGRPVHCIILLGTPPGAQDRHLEVVAAFARVIGDRQVRHQLYHTKSPAHAYELLHTHEESEDFNYFLEDDPDPRPTPA